MDDTNSTKLKAALQEIDNKIHSTYSSFDVKMALVASRTIGASSYKTGFLSNIIESNSYNYPSLIEQAFTNLGKIKFSETASPLGILELALRVNPSFLRKNSSTLFVVVTERDEPNGQFFDIESRLRAFTEGRHSLLLVTKEALTYVNYIATNKNAHRVPLEAATSDSLSQAIWGEVNYLRQDEFKEDSASDGTLIEY